MKLMVWNFNIYHSLTLTIHCQVNFHIHPQIVITMELDKMSILMAPNHGIVWNLLIVRSKSMEPNHGLVWNLISVRSKPMVPIMAKVGTSSVLAQNQWN